MRIRLKEIRRWLLSDERYLKATFSKHLGYPLNLDDPQTLNEKLQWLKLYAQTPLQTLCADKLAVRAYVREQLGERYLIPLLGHTQNPNDLTVEKLPDVPFILKANHTSGTYRIVRDKHVEKWGKIQAECANWLRYKHYLETKEFQYKAIPPCILIEQLLTDEHGAIPSDIKFSCINGRVEIIHIDSNKEQQHLRNHYDRDWNSLPMCWPAVYHKAPLQPRPAQLDTLIALAEQLAQPFAFVRVDFYLNRGQIYFGEITFHPTAGFGRFEPAQCDLNYGQMLKLPEASSYRPA